MPTVTKETKGAATITPNATNSANKGPSKQELATCRIELEKKRAFSAQLEDTLRQVKLKPNIYNAPLLKPLRDFCEYRDNNRNKFIGIVEETSSLQPSNGGMPVNDLTSNYIQTIANYGDTSHLRNPTLQVVSSETKFRKTPFKKVYGKEQQDVKITHLRLMDGDNNVMMGRCAINITDEGKKLKEGDIIQLDMYTELTHTLGEKNGKSKPVVYIIKFSLVGYKHLPNPNYINIPLECDKASLQRQIEGKTIHLDKIEEVECSGSCCSLYGINMLQCVCKTNPIERMNLQTLKDECWFADREVEAMTNSHIRCMLYWWFATNIYAICGSKNRAPLPECLVAAVRKEYPDPDGNYTGYEAQRYIGSDPADN